ncbi:MAG: sigma-E processing peptidase SpoIIGA, partial [Eubacteriales bacterium]
SVILWGVGALLSGIMTFIINVGPHMVNTDISSGFSEIFIICAAVSCLLVRMFSAAKSKKSAEVSFVYQGQKYTFDGLCDSGSHACEPISSLPAIIVNQKALGELGHELEREEIRVKLRLIPIKTAAGEKLLRGFVPDKVFIDGKEVAAVIASDSCCGDYSGYSAIIPAKLF